jgi:hypothetical protein
LHDDARRFLDDPETAGLMTAETIDGDHGRIEPRTAAISTDVDWLWESHAWPGLQANGKIARIRETPDKIARETSYFLPSARLSPERLLG